MSKQKIVYLDLDGTIADLQGRLLFYEPNMESGYGEGATSQFYKVCYENRNIFFELEPIEGAIKAVEELKDIFDLYFLSVPMWDLQESFTDKRRWVGEHFGAWSRNRLILSAHKHLSRGDFLVDDTTRHGVDKFEGEHIHIHTPKFPNWQSVTDYLKTKV